MDGSKYPFHQAVWEGDLAQAKAILAKEPDRKFGPSSLFPSSPILNIGFYTLIYI